MDKAMHTMIENLQKNTGRSLEQWVGIVNATQLSRHSDIVNFLKNDHGFTHGFANLVAHKAKESLQGPAQAGDDLVAAQYKGKEHFKALYDQLITVILRFGNDIEIAPKNTYVSLRRKKQFATLQPATKTRFEIGINLKGQAPEGKLEPQKPNSMCSHKINLGSSEDIDQEILNWLKAAYDKAG